MNKKPKRRTISFTVDSFEYDEIMTYARAKGHESQFPTSAFAHYAVFQQMKKYPLNDKERAQYTQVPKEGNER